jgi:nicotinic acid phosphoribosyltransferase
MHEETDFYNFTMDYLGPRETNTKHSIWQAIPRDVGMNKQPRVMAGGRAIIRQARAEYPEANLEFCLLQDGMPFLAGDPVLQVLGDKSTARKLEPKILSTLFYMTEIATRTKEIIDTFGADRIIEVGMRAQAPGSWKLSGEAYLIGGGKLTSNTSLRNEPTLFEGRDYKLVGTTGHSLYLEYMAAGYSQKEAFASILDKFELNFPNKPCALLVDTVDSMTGIKQALEVIKKRKSKSGQTHYIRIDSGDLLSQTKYALSEMTGSMPDFKVIIEDGLTIDKMKLYDSELKAEGFHPESNVIYGAGGYFVNHITRDENGAWAYKPSAIGTTTNGLVSVIKESDSPFKKSLPSLIGINYKTSESRLQLFTHECTNKMLDKAGQDKYLSLEVDALIHQAKPYWNLIKDANPNWLNSYDMSGPLRAVQSQASKRIKEFGEIPQEKVCYARV